MGSAPEEPASMSWLSSGRHAAPLRGTAEHTTSRRCRSAPARRQPQLRASVCPGCGPCSFLVVKTHGKPVSVHEQHPAQEGERRNYAENGCNAGNHLGYLIARHEPMTCQAPDHWHNRGPGCSVVPHVGAGPRSSDRQRRHCVARGSRSLGAPARRNSRGERMITPAPLAK